MQLLLPDSFIIGAFFATLGIVPAPESPLCWLLQREHGL